MFLAVAPCSCSTAAIAAAQPQGQWIEPELRIQAAANSTAEAKATFQLTTPLMSVDVKV